MGEVYGWLKNLALPPASLLLLIVGGWLIATLGRRRLGRLMAGVGVALLIGLSMPFVGTTLLRGLETGPAIETPSADAAPSANAAQAIVVLTGDYRRWSPEYGRSELGPLSLERVRYGARLHRLTGLPILISGGQLPPLDRPIARMMSDVLAEDFQVQARWLETRSLNTHENAAFSTAILRDAGITRIYLVTHGWHMARALRSFAGSGLTVIPAPMGLRAPPVLDVGSLLPSAHALADSAFAIHEHIGLLWYAIAYR